MWLCYQNIKTYVFLLCHFSALSRELRITVFKTAEQNKQKESSGTEKKKIKSYEQ